MKLTLVSDDQSLLVHCREIAREFAAFTWELGMQETCPTDPDADLCIWDYRPGISLPSAMKWATRHFVLVASQDVDEFRIAHRYAEASIILKPVTRAVLRALMSQAVASREKDDHTDRDEPVRSDRNDILQCLIQANLRLQQYDKERTNFLSRALHDFHAPLTALTGYCGLLLEQQLGPLQEQQKLVLNRMNHSTRRLARITRGMFNLSVGKTVECRPVLQPGDINQCAEQALYEVSQFLEEKQIEVNLALEPLSSPLMFESGQIEQVFINLLENACKFTPRFGSISVTGYPYFWDRRAANVLCRFENERRIQRAQGPNAYRIDIADSGPGVPTEHSQSIFEEYISYSGGQDRSGAGLGLAICRMILNQHGGRIWTENGPSGAIFSFTLPFRAPETAPPCSQGVTEQVPLSLVAYGK